MSMIDEFIESTESNLKLYKQKQMSAELFIDWLKVDLKKFKKQKERLSEQRTTVFYSDEKTTDRYASAKTD